MGTDLQRLRDEAERLSLVAAKNNDRDSADAWERVALAIDDCVKATRNDLRTIEARTGLFEVRIP